MCVVSVYMAGNSNDTKQKKVGMKVAADDKRDDCSLINLHLSFNKYVWDFPVVKPKTTRELTEKNLVQ